MYFSALKTLLNNEKIGEENFQILSDKSKYIEDGWKLNNFMLSSAYVRIF